MAEERKIELQLVKEETGEVVGTGLPRTSAECVKCEDGANVEERVNYTNDTPIVSATGDISVGETFDSVPVTEMLTKILYPYVAPTVAISSTTAAGVKEIGTSFTPTFTVTPTKKSRPITKVALYRGSTEIKSNTDGSVLTHTDSAVTATTTFKATVSDGKSEISSSNLTYTFVNPLYVGVLNTDNPTEADITAMEKRVVSKSTQTCTYSVTEQRMACACPPGWTLTRITDPNNFDYTQLFEKNKKIVSVNGVDYTVYMSDPTTQTGFTMTFA